MNTIVYGYMIYCLLGCTTDPVRWGDIYFKTYVACVRYADEQAQKIWPEAKKISIDCMKHGLQPNDKDVKIEE